MPTTPERVLDIARKELKDKVKETPPQSNSVKYNQWYYGRDAREPWCAAFVSWCFYEAGLPLPASTAKGFVYTPAGAAWFQRNGRWVEAGERRPEPGWVVFFDFPGDGVNRISHVGIVEEPRADGFLALEGNTDEKGGRTGGKVMRQVRRTRGVVGFGIPDFDVGNPTVPRLDLPPWTYEETDVETKLVEIDLDDNGRGWTQFTPTTKKGKEPVPVGIVPQGPYPPTDGYWDDADEDLTFRAQHREGNIVVSAVNGAPRTRVMAWVSYA